MKSDEIFNKLISIYFRKGYHGFGEVTKDEEQWLKNTFKVRVTESTKKNGYSGYDKILEIDKEYTFNDMSVSQSSSYLTLKEFPNKTFNTVNFKYRIDE